MATARAVSWERMMQGGVREVAVIGSGIAGLSCAWLLSAEGSGCRVTLHEAADRLGGHSHTVNAGTVASPLPVDTGFIVYNEPNYPNLVALFAHLGVATKDAQMSFGVSLDDGRLEYGSQHPLALLAQPSNLLRPRYWSMVADLLRFYRSAPIARAKHGAALGTLGEFLDAGRYGKAFQEDHLLPQIGAIWSSTPAQARDYPAEALIRFFENHGLLKVLSRPQWRTVDGGSRAYVEKIAAPFAERVRLNARVVEVRRTPGGVTVRDAHGRQSQYDAVVIAAHADQALAMLAEPSAAESDTLGAFRYSRNLAVLHEDRALMPRRRGAWSAWNHIGRRGDAHSFCVTYWMNALQGLKTPRQLFVTLNPCREVAPDKIVRTDTYDHPLFDAPAIAAQHRLWALQGRGGVYYCGSYFGSGFHEDGLQAGLAAAEMVSSVRRPWRVAGESDRIYLGSLEAPPLSGLAA